MENASDNNKIYGAIASGKDTTTTINKDAKDDNYDEELIVGIPQFWVCTMGHMEAVVKLITERYIYCVEHLTDVTCREFEDGTGFEFSFNFYINTNKHFTDELLINIYEVPNLLLDDEPILKKITGCDIHWEEGRSLTYGDIRKKYRSKRSIRAGKIRTFNKR